MTGNCRPLVLNLPLCSYLARRGSLSLISLARSGQPLVTAGLAMFYTKWHCLLFTASVWIEERICLLWLAASQDSVGRASERLQSTESQSYRSTTPFI